MPFLMIPIILFIVGLVIMVVLLVGFALIHVLFWPVVIGLLIWWLIRRSDHHGARPAHHRTDWQDYVQPGRKVAHNVHEESRPKQPPREDHDDWSDF
ncbi:hypothetical protein [Lacticaseibacillus absianus]|uniref:hypothetical protein n=1 Tax=Lacticaseibacillus absianus TaxID=2729623 RepID=UPI0015CE8C94|nr:hypothetical protein [Lacticaseibacillus absianus]